MIMETEQKLGFKIKCVMEIKLPKIAKFQYFSGFLQVNKDLTEFNSSRY
jgi:hypothetical protein